MRARSWSVFGGFILAGTLTLLGGGRAAAQTTADFFNDSILHEIRLDIHPNDWAILKRDFRENTYYTCDFQWRYQGRLILVPNIAIRSRGTGSRSPDKPGLRIDFDRNETTQTFLGLKSVILRNNTQDPSQLHERLSMLMFRRMGVPASRETHVRFYVNDTYIGLYTVVESVDKAFLKLQFNENDGFLYKYDYPPEAAPYYFGYKGSDPTLYSPLPFKPETHETDPNPAPLVDMIRTVNQAGDQEFQTRVGEYLNLKLFLSHLAVEMFMADQDGFLGDFGMNNFYMYRFERKNLNQLIAWDKSNTFSGLNGSVFHNVPQNVLVRRVLSYPELKTYYMEQIAKAAGLAGGEGGWLQQEIDREYNQIRASALEDPNKQCYGPDGVMRKCSNEEFEKGVSFLREFARERNNFVLAELAANGYAAATPNLPADGAVNAASFAKGGALTPGSLISIFGERLSSTTAFASALPLPTELGGASVKINNIAAPLLYVSPGQINLQVPWEAGLGAGTISVSVNGAASNTISVNLGVAPGVFVAVHAADNSPVTADRPAVAGEVLVIYATGLGPVTGSVTSGQGAPGSPPATTTQPPSVTIGGVAGVVEFSGLAPDFVGLYQVNVRLGSNVPAGSDTPLVISIGGEASPAKPLATR